MLIVEIECVDLPPADWDGHRGICIGIQNGDAMEQRVELPVEGALLVASLRVGDANDAKPNFLGPFAHGPKGARFIYVGWGTQHRGMWVGFRRAKLPLDGLDWAAVESGVVRARLRCTDAKGGPICATVKAPFFEWL